MLSHGRSLSRFTSNGFPALSKPNQTENQVLVMSGAIRGRASRGTFRD
jgi:hypothetical protein